MHYTQFPFWEQEETYRFLSNRVVLPLELYTLLAGTLPTNLNLLAKQQFVRFGFGFNVIKSLEANVTALQKENDRLLAHIGLNSEPKAN